MEYHVDSEWGYDGNSGTKNFPWKTIGKVNEFIFLPGDSVLFKCGGEWVEQLFNWRSIGEEGNPITFGAYGDGSMPLLKNGIRIDGCRENPPDFIVIDGLEVTSSTGRGIWMLEVDGCVVRDCVVHDIAPGGEGEGVGINFDGYAGSIDGAMVEWNRVYNTADIGIQLENCFNGPVVRNNVISECLGNAGLVIIAYPEHESGEGILVPGMQGVLMGGEIYGNLIYKCTTGIKVIKTAGWEFTSNKIMDGLEEKCGVVWWCENKEHMQGLKWNHNTITNCSQIMLFKPDFDLLQVHDYNCYRNGVFNQLDPWLTWEFTDFREGTGQEKHSIEVVYP